MGERVIEGSMTLEQINAPCPPDCPCRSDAARYLSGEAARKKLLEEHRAWLRYELVRAASEAEREEVRDG